jgi:hypothetical protein
MKRIFTLFAALLLITVSYASFNVTTPPKNASEVFITLGKSGKQISLMDLAEIKTKDFEVLSGRPMSVIDKAGFKVAQRKLRKSINADGTINNKKLNKIASEMASGETGFHIGGFALGFLLGLIGVLIAYVIKDDKKSNRVKWAWIGLGVIVLINVVVFLL